MKKLIFSLIFMISSWACMAQKPLDDLKLEKNSSVSDDTNSLTDEAVRAFEELTRQKMVEFQNELSIVPDSMGYNFNERRMAIKTLMEKFWDADKCLIEVSSLRTGKVRAYSITDYLENLFLLGNKEEVKIEFYEKSKISNFQKVGPNKYEAVAVYYQLFKSGPYKDKTEKKVEIKLTYSKNPNDENKYQVSLGNIKVVQTMAVKKK